ncbi:hypothetical protein P256_00240 [Acinetobacter nectaris CIP 110549]|uniref:Uncharacterized protein n=1 Tax=Acinetobacter nectaris CIP 110549 TaxID=1392540 RepID=V2TT82_9GAMM|nr:hypothetical protein [Acinetobacter nectaris]ESK41251.1 hypothetical protein P256_00240 [Acinetobacter nectaris CIP 110549]
MKNKEFQELIYLMQSLANKAQIYYKNHEKEFVLIGSKIQNFLEHSLKQKIIASNMSKEGWFPSSFVFRTSINDGESNESFMRRVIKNHYEQIQETLYSGYPNRAEIFTEMFESLECGRYRYFMMECFAQIDGICTDSGYSPFFSKEYDKKMNLKEIL